jgi:hypothetical protein
LQITLKGLASQNVWIFKVSDEDLDLTLMDFLRKNQMMIASSCSGAGICKKCVIQDEILSCRPTVREFLQGRPQADVIVSYL